MVHPPKGRALATGPESRKCSPDSHTVAFGRAGDLSEKKAEAKKQAPFRRNKENNSAAPTSARRAGGAIMPAVTVMCLNSKFFDAAFRN